MLPADVAARIDWATLRREPGSYADQVGESRTDVLFSAQMGSRRAYLYVIFEHQSSADVDMPLRMLTYMGRIWRGLRGAQTARAPLPVIIPVVLHHGPRRWRGPRRLSDLLELDAAVRERLAPHVPDFEVIVDDLARVPEVELLRREMPVVPKLVVWVLRAIRFGVDPALASLRASALNLEEVERGAAAVAHVVRYLTEREEGIHVLEALRDAQPSEGVREMVEGLARRWLEEGIEKGLQKGREEGRQAGRLEGRAELLLRQLRLRFPDLSPEEENRVRTAAIDELDRWADRVITAGSLHEVFD